MRNLDSRIKKLEDKVKPLSLHTKPVPKPGQGQGQSQPLTLAEWANIGKELVATYAQMRQGYRLIDAAKQRQNQILADVNSRLGNSSPDLNEPCSNCGFINCVCEK